MQYIINYIGLNAIFYIVAYFGFYKGIGGAQNLLIFYAWLAFITSIICIIAYEKMVNAMSERPFFVPTIIATTFSIFNIFLYIWHDFIVSGLVYMVASFISGCIIHDAKKIKASV